MNYVLYGKEQFLLDEALKNIIKSHVHEDNELNTITYNATNVDIQVILEDACTLPFFSDCKVILITHATFLSASNDTQIDTSALEAYLEHPMESTILVLLGDFEKMDARKKIVKKVQKTCKVLQFRKLDEIGKQNYVVEELRKRSLVIEETAKKELIKRLPLDILTIRHELDKLALYGDRITSDIVRTLVTRPLEEDVFLLVNAVVERKMKDAFHLWQDMCVLNKDAIYLIALLAGQFRFLYQVKALMLRGLYKEEIVSELSAHPYRVQLTIETCKNLNIDYLLAILDKLANLDQNLKAGRLDKKLGFEMFLLGLGE
ncbi:MAG: DNA polymerase III subunit delta [Longicatena sp.]